MMISFYCIFVELSNDKKRFFDWYLINAIVLDLLRHKINRLPRKKNSMMTITNVIFFGSHECYFNNNTNIKKTCQ